MVNTLYKYDLYNVITKKYEFIDVKLCDIAKYIGISENAASKYACTGYIIKKTYQIRKTKITIETFEERWDKACLKLNPSAKRFNSEVIR